MPTDSVQSHLAGLLEVADGEARPLGSRCAVVWHRHVSGSIVVPAMQQRRRRPDRIGNSRHRVDVDRATVRAEAAVPGAEGVRAVRGRRRRPGHGASRVPTGRQAGRAVEDRRWARSTSERARSTTTMNRVGRRSGSNPTPAGKTRRHDGRRNRWSRPAPVRTLPVRLKRWQPERSAPRCWPTPAWSGATSSSRSAEAAARHADTLVQRLGLTGYRSPTSRTAAPPVAARCSSAANAIRSGAAEIALAVGFDKHPRGAFDPRPAPIGDSRVVRRGRADGHHAVLRHQDPALHARARHHPTDCWRRSPRRRTATAPEPQRLATQAM